MSNKTLWETQNGQKWLAKAIDPAGNTVDVKGLPDQESHNVVVLNYQSQFAVSPPNLFNSEGNDGTTFESEMYLFQHPYLFGVAATYPTGTDEILTHTTGYKINFGKNPTTNADNETVPGVAPSISFIGSSGNIFPRTATTLRNSQVAGSTNLKQTFENFSKMAQQHRVIYGAAQLVPTCSVQDNSGTISVSQQPFVCDHGNNDSINCYKDVTGSQACDDDSGGSPRFTDRASMTLERFLVDVYRENDYPDADDNIRNPASLLTRFYEGAYIPYKLKNPFHETFCSSHTGVLHISPAWVVGAAYSTAVAGAASFSEWTTMTWDVGSKSFVPNYQSGSTTERTQVLAARVRLSLMTKTGQIVHFVWTNPATYETNANYTCTQLWTSAPLLNSIDKDLKLVSTGNSITPIRVHVDQDDTHSVYYYRYNDTGRPIAPFPNDNVTAIICKAMSMKGNINILIRLGVEMQVTGESTYSPFNHRSPEYDEAALKSYLRVVHRMSDGFYGNAASDMLKESYYNWYIQALYAPEEDVDYANRGSYWRGLISVK